MSEDKRTPLEIMNEQMHQCCKLISDERLKQKPNEEELFKLLRYQANLKDRIDGENLREANNAAKKAQLQQKK
jgi:hypothetical protein